MYGLWNLPRSVSRGPRAASRLFGLRYQGCSRRVEFTVRSLFFAYLLLVPLLPPFFTQFLQPDDRRRESFVAALGRPTLAPPHGFTPFFSLGFSDPPRPFLEKACTAVRPRFCFSFATRLFPFIVGCCGPFPSISIFPLTQLNLCVWDLVVLLREPPSSVKRLPF